MQILRFGSMLEEHEGHISHLIAKLLPGIKTDRQVGGQQTHGYELTPCGDMSWSSLTACYMSHSARSLSKEDGAHSLGAPLPYIELWGHVNLKNAGGQ
jgi:hypothetical protein